MTTDESDVSELASEVVRELKPGTTIGDKVILSRAQVAAVIGGSATLAGVIGFGGGTVAAEPDGRLGADGEPIEATLSNYRSEPTAEGYEMTIEGDTWEFNE